MTNGDAKDIDKSPYIIIVGAGYAYRIVFDSRKLLLNCFSFSGPTESQESQLLFSSSANSVMKISL